MWRFACSWASVIIGWRYQSVLLTRLRYSTKCRSGQESISTSSSTIIICMGHAHHHGEKSIVDPYLCSDFKKMIIGR